MAKVDDKVATLEQTVNEMQDTIRKLARELNMVLEVASTANNGVMNLRDQVKVLTESAKANNEALTKRYK